MSEETQEYLFGPTEYTNPGFKATLDCIREVAKKTPTIRSGFLMLAMETVGITQNRF